MPTNIYQELKDGDHNEPISEENLFSSSVIAFYVSLTKEKPGKISFASAPLTEILGWSQNEVLGNNINIVMPYFMREDHDEILQNHLKQPFIDIEHSKMYKDIDTFILEKSGNYFAL